MKKKTGWLSTIGLIGILMLLSHQNCASSNMASDESGASGGVTTGSPSQAPSPVTIIDDSKSQAGLSFKISEIQITQRTDVVPLEGLCSSGQDGANFGWQLKEINSDGSLGASILSGSTTCSSGSFQVSVPAANGLGCGQRFKLSARLGFGSPAEVTVSKICL
jgi:hypothetical protein